MSTYEQLKGLKVKYLSADTSGDRSVEGELFYNSSDFGLKSHIAVGAFSAGGNMLTARRAMTGGAGTQTAGLIAGGYVTALMNNTEEYNGNGWSSSGNLPTALYYISVAGTQTAGLAIGGGDPVKQETLEYNGSAWTDVGNAPEIRKMLGRAGTQTASLFAGGNDGPNAASSEAFTYDGTNFTNITDLPSNRGAGHAAGGSQTASVHAGGSLGPPGLATTTVEWDGSSWSEGGSYPLPGQNQYSSSPSGYNQFVGGGYYDSAVSNKTLFYDGSTWSALADMGTARQQGAGFGSETAAAFCGGTTGSVTTATEEFNVTTSTITGAAWAAGGNMNTARNLAAGAGTQNAAWIAGGNNPGTTYGVIHEQYNGTAWTEAADLNTPRNRLRGAGSQAAALAFGGFDPGGSSNASEEWNGSSWAEGNNLNTGRRTPGNFGTQTAAVACGGTNPGASPTAHVGTEEYNGTSWSNTNALNAVSPGGSGSGTQTAGLNAMNPGGVSEDYDGSSWATGPSMMIARNAGGSSIEGTQTATQFFAGSPSPTASEQFNGTTFISDASLANGRSSNCGGGTSALSLCFGDNANAEEYTPETTAVNAAKTIDFD